MGLLIRAATARYVDDVMGLLEQVSGIAQEKQKQSLVEEATAAGCAVGGFTRLIDEEEAARGRVGRAIGNAAVALVGGRMEPDVFEILHLETAGVRHIFVMPFAGSNALVGEHHAVLPGAVAAPVVFGKGGLLRTRKWRGPDLRVATRFNDCKALKAVVKKCRWEWMVVFSTIHLRWTVQVRSLGEGRIHLVLRAGRYSRLPPFEVGFAQFLAIWGALPAVADAFHAPPQPFVEEGRFDELAVSRLLGAPQSA